MKKFILNTGIIATSCASIVGVISCTDSDTTNPGGTGDNGGAGGSDSTKLLKEDANIEEAYIVIPEQSLFMTYKQDDSKSLFEVNDDTATLNEEMVQKIADSLKKVSKTFDTVNLKLKGRKNKAEASSAKTYFMELSIVNASTEDQIKSLIATEWAKSPSKKQPTVKTAQQASDIANNGFTDASSPDPGNFSSKVSIPGGPSGSIINTQLAVVRRGVFKNFLPSQDEKTVSTSGGISISTINKNQVVSGTGKVPYFARRLLYSNFQVLNEDHFSIVMSIATVLAKQQANAPTSYTNDDVINYHKAFVKAANASFSEGIVDDDLDSTTLLEELKSLNSEVAEFLQEGELLVKTDV